MRLRALLLVMACLPGFMRHLLIFFVRRGLVTIVAPVGGDAALLALVLGWYWVDLRQCIGEGFQPARPRRGGKRSAVGRQQIEQSHQHWVEGVKVSRRYPHARGALGASCPWLAPACACP